MNMIAFWDMASCSLVEADQDLRGGYCSYHRPDDGGSNVNTFVLSVQFYESTWRDVILYCTKYYSTKVCIFRKSITIETSLYGPLSVALVTVQPHKFVRPPSCAPSATIICREKVVLPPGYYTAHFKHCVLFLDRRWGRFGRTSRRQIRPSHRSTKTLY
jgi:hypothetical protein